MRTIRLAGVALVTIAALALAGSGALDGFRAPMLLAPAAGLAQETAPPADSQATAREAAGHDATAAHDASARDAASGEEDGDHSNPVANVLVLLMLVMLAAKLGGSLMEHIGQPGVLGELIFGVILGNLSLIGIPFWEDLIQLQIHFHAFGGGSTEVISAEKIIEILGEIGVILLLFEVGLESNVKEMMSVGLSSFLVALFGVIAPFFLGWGVGAWLLPNEEIWVHVFLGATLCATSVGITARVLKDLGRLQLRESKIILGAAVIDDIMGLVVLAVVMGLIAAANTGQAMSIGSVAWIVGKAVLFLVLAVLIGQWAAPRIFKLASKMKGQHLLLTTSLLILFVFSYLANRIGLATIVGAFAAGLILDPVDYQDFKDREKHPLEELLHPLAGFLVPVFFVRMGYMVDLSSFGNTSILAFAGLLTLAAIIGKQVCSLGVLEKGLDKLSVGVGMIPRGEVGLIFAGIGATLILHGHQVISPDTFSAVVIMVIVTTLVTPPALKWSLNRPRGYEGASDEEMRRITEERRQKRRDYFREQAREDRRRDGTRDRSRRDRSGRDRSGRPRSGGERSGGERSGGERKGSGRPEDERAGSERGGRDRREREQRPPKTDPAPATNPGDGDRKSGKRRRRPRRRGGRGGRGGAGGSTGGGSFNDLT